MKNSSLEYHSGKLGAMVNLIVAIAKKNPQALDNPDFLKAQLKLAMPSLARKDVCPNCEASMAEYVYRFDFLDALLLTKMAQEVKHRKVSGVPFTIANQVRIPNLSASHVIKCRTTKASKLGLVAQLRNANDRRVAGVWVITRRGWEALAGKEVPLKVKVWRGRIEERFGETTTISEAFNSHREHVKKLTAKGRNAKQDYRTETESYNPSEWYEFGIHEGALL